MNCDPLKCMYPLSPIITPPVIKFPGCPSLMMEFKMVTADWLFTVTVGAALPRVTYKKTESNDSCWLTSTPDSCRLLTDSMLTVLGSFQYDLMVNALPLKMLARGNG